MLIHGYLFSLDKEHYFGEAYLVRIKNIALLGKEKEKEKNKYVGLWCLHSYGLRWASVYQHIKKTKLVFQARVDHETTIDVPARLFEVEDAPFFKKLKIDARDGAIDSTFDFFAFSIETENIDKNVLKKAFEVKDSDPGVDEGMFVHLNENTFYEGWVYAVVSDDACGILLCFYDHPFQSTLYTSGAPIFSKKTGNFLGLVSAGDHFVYEKKGYQYMTACSSKFIYQHLKQILHYDAEQNSEK